MRKAVCRFKDDKFCQGIVYKVETVYCDKCFQVPMIKGYKVIGRSSGIEDYVNIVDFVRLFKFLEE